jgi:hypothetical protein
MAQAHTAPGHHFFSPFWRHVVTMFGVMVGGMVVSAAIFLTIVGIDWEQATRDYPTAALLVIAAGMTIPMTGWMLYRGIGRKNSTEMAAVMAIPVLPFLGLVWFGVTDSALCGPYCLVGLIGMVGLMLLRRDEYSMEMSRETTAR